MDEKRIGVHALSLTTPMVNWASPALGLALAQAYNDAASAAHRKHPERFVGLAILRCRTRSLRCASWSAPRSCPACAACISPPTSTGSTWTRSVLGRLCQGGRARLGDLPAPGRHDRRERTGKYHLRNLLGNPYDTGWRRRT